MFDKVLCLDNFQSFVCGILDLVWIGHGFFGNTFSCNFSSIGWPYGIPCLPTFYHIDVREVVLSWWRTQELKESPSYNWCISDWFLFPCARNARTCSRSYRHSKMADTLCNAFSRVIHMIRCSQQPESFVLIVEKINDWFCRRSCWKAWINCRMLVLCACLLTECCNPGIRKNMSPSFTIINSWFSSWSAMDFSIFSRSTSSSTLNFHEKNVLETSFSRFQKTTGRSVLSEELKSFAKYINIDFLRTGRVSAILHVIRSSRCVTNWIWSWLSWLEEFYLSSNFFFWLSSNRTQFFPFVFQWDFWRRSKKTCLLFRVKLLQFSF